MIIAVDFDDTIYMNASANTSLIYWLIERQAEGNHIMLYTCRQGESRDFAIQYCESLGLYVNSVCDNKPLADMYIDDKAVKPWDVVKANRKMSRLREGK